MFFCRGQALFWMDSSCYQYFLEKAMPEIVRFQCPHRLELLRQSLTSVGLRYSVSMPSRAWVVTRNYGLEVVETIVFQCPHGLELLLYALRNNTALLLFQCPHGLELLQFFDHLIQFLISFNALTGLSCYHSRIHAGSVKTMFQCPHGLELLLALLCLQRQG